MMRVQEQVTRRFATSATITFQLAPYTLATANDSKLWSWPGKDIQEVLSRRPCACKIFSAQKRCAVAFAHDCDLR